MLTTGLHSLLSYITQGILSMDGTTMNWTLPHKSGRGFFSAKAFSPPNDSSLCQNVKLASIKEIEAKWSVRVFEGKMIKYYIQKINISQRSQL